MRKNQNKVLVILLSIVIFAFLIVRASKNSVTTVTASELGVNLVSNDSFEGLGAPNSWSYPWILYTNYGYTGSLNQDITTSIDGSSSARLGIGVTGTSSTNVSLVQRYIPTDANSTYTIDFWAKAAQPRNINVLVQDGTGTGIYVHQYFNSTVALSTNWQEYTLTYPATQSLADTFLTFGVGQSTSDVWIDYVYMGIGPRAASPTPTLTPTNIPTNTPTATPTATPTPTPTPDIIAPSVSITSPVNGAKVKRDTDVTIYGSATDNVGVTRVKFYSNGTLLCTDTTSPYSCIWHVPKALNVSYLLTADAFDAVGNIGHSDQVVVKSIK